jgi:hypothetical protein
MLYRLTVGPGHRVALPKLSRMKKAVNYQRPQSALGYPTSKLPARTKPRPNRQRIARKCSQAERGEFVVYSGDGL